MAESQRMGMGRRFASIALILLVIAIAAAASSPSRAAALGFTEFSATPSNTQAGGHPNLDFGLRFVTPGTRVLRTHLPTGFIGNPHVAPKCTLTEFTQGACSSDAQIAVLAWEFSPEHFYYFPAYNMETSPDQSGLLGFTVPVVSASGFLELSGRTDSDYGLDSVSTPLLRAFSIDNILTRLWGVPADPANNVLRFATPLENAGVCLSATEGCPAGTEFQSQTHAEPTVPARPFLQNPTECGVPLVSTADIEYYGGEEFHAQDSWPPTTGCKQLRFSPNLTLKPTTSQADTASGVDVTLKVPQTQSPDTPSPSELRTARVITPEGFTINPNAADGKVACADQDTAIGTLFAATCPEYAKVGTVTVDSSALPGPIPGALYLGEPKPGDRYRLILTADGFATHIKLTVSVRLDPDTGRVATVFEDLPQSPLQEINMHFFGSERGLLATPTHCGTYEVEGEFVPWDAELTTRHTISYMTIDQGPGGTPCPNGPRPFAPRLSAATANSTAAMHSSFSLILNRDDGEQNLAGIKVRTPPGFAATLKGIPYCSQAALAQLTSASYTGSSEQASPSCQPESQIGTATAGAGAGTHPLYVDGKVYLAGPYKGAPLSLVTVIPAISGPYDLGNVAVRAAIDVDPSTAQVTTTTDPLPQILEGIPLRTRYIRVNLDRPDFTFNPTNCDLFAVDSTIAGSEGASSSPSTHFQASNCADLGFAPKLSLKLVGSPRRRAHPAFQAVLKTAPGEANIARASVALPKSLLLDNAHIGTVCTRIQFAAKACPAGSIIGEAQATTPILDAPLKGPVYLRTSNAKLPDVVASLEGQFDVELVGHIDTPRNSGLRTTFTAVPDAPVSEFKLNLKGGSAGLFFNSKNLCKSPPSAKVQMQGQNGRQTTSRTRLRTACSSKAKKSNKRHDKREG